ncbi:MAG: helix-turn-helix domain-containing protein [Youngiibacter sp.]|nr:helix-turn-helix domain-containing protein [Youngiibacter sp.]
MQNIQLLLNNPKLSFFDSHVHVREFESIQSIEFMTIRTKMQPRTLYIVASQIDIDSMDIFKLPFPSILVLTSNVTLSETSTRQFNGSILYSSMDPFNLYNDINEVITSYSSWEHKFKLLEIGSNGYQKLVDTGVEMLDCQIAFISSGYSVISYNNKVPKTNSFMDELIRNGYITSSYLDMILEARKNAEFEDSTIIIPSTDGTSIIIVSINYHLKNMGYLVFNAHDEQTRYRIMYYNSVLLSAIRSLVNSSISIGKYSNNSAFQSLVSDLIELKIENKDEIDARLEMMKVKMKKIYLIMLVEFDTVPLTPAPINYIVSQLERIIPNCIVTTYLDDIVIWCQRSQFDSCLFDNDALSELLKKYNARIGISNPSKHYLFLNTFYLQCKSAIKFGKNFAADDNKLIYYYEEIRLMDIIDMCSTNFRTKYNHGNLIYLCDPAILWLVHHDRKHNTNLADVLYAYLMNDCNSTKTSKQLNLHRNTMLYKIDKIESLLNRSLSDGTFRLNLMFSYLAIKYLQEYKKIDPWDIKFN